MHFSSLPTDASACSWEDLNVKCIAEWGNSSIISRTYHKPYFPYDFLPVDVLWVWRWEYSLLMNRYRPSLHGQPSACTWYSSISPGQCRDFVGWLYDVHGIKNNVLFWYRILQEDSVLKSQNLTVCVYSLDGVNLRSTQCFKLSYTHSSTCMLPWCSINQKKYCTKNKQKISKALKTVTYNYLQHTCWKI